jgi:hypothetical protein
LKVSVYQPQLDDGAAEHRRAPQSARRPLRTVLYEGSPDADDADCGSHIGSTQEGIAMNRVAKTLVLVLLVTIAAGAFAADASSPRAGKTWSITFYDSTKVGTTMLPKGSYKAQHLADGDIHVLVFKDESNKEKARVNCTVEQLGSKAAETKYDIDKNDAGENVLQSVVFAGDRYKHKAVTP